MKSLWDDKKAQKFGTDPLQQRVYTSRLLGRDSALVMHGGGNTSVKINKINLFGKREAILYVKGSGWDLATIEAQGFAPVKLKILQKMAKLQALIDSDMVKTQRSAMTDPSAPNPSVEAVLHALIPFKFVDHTHADAVVAISNTLKGKERIREIYGNRVLIVPYVMPGFVLAKKVYEMTQNIDWNKLKGIVLMNHGVFTFADDAKISYESMIKLVDEAERYLNKKRALTAIAKNNEKSTISWLILAKLRKNISAIKGSPMLARLNQTPESLGFSNLSTVDAISTRGPLTPDHVIRTKRIPLIIQNNELNSLEKYADNYLAYFDRNTDGKLTCLDSAPRWAVLKKQGIMAFGSTVKELNIIQDIAEHTIRAIQWGEKLDAWQALPENDIFDVEYWALEQAKLSKKTQTPILQGKIAWVTGAAQGIGFACVKELEAQGAVVVALDILPEMTKKFNSPNVLELVCDVTNEQSIKKALETTICTFGGLDILISNAGVFPASYTLENMDSKTWQGSIDLNLTSHQSILKACVPYLRQGIDPAVVFMASKNVPAPGKGAGAYSVAKAGLTQLARIAALELAVDKIRVNVLHPHGVFDTALWTPEILASRAQYYGMTVEEYKTNNLLKTEITTKDVAKLATALVSPLFSKITGVQLPIDGGNERVI